MCRIDTSNWRWEISNWMWETYIWSWEIDWRWDLQLEWETSDWEWEMSNWSWDTSDWRWDLSLEVRDWLQWKTSSWNWVASDWRWGTADCRWETSNWRWVTSDVRWEVSDRRWETSNSSSYLEVFFHTVWGNHNTWLHQELHTTVFLNVVCMHVMSYTGIVVSSCRSLTSLPVNSDPIFFSCYLKTNALGLRKPKR